MAALAPVLRAQDAAGVGTIEGHVRAQGTSRPVEGAQVHVVGANMDATTNADGVYRIANVPARDVQLRIRMLGFASVTRNVTVQAGSTQTVDFTLSASAVQLEAIVTTGTAGATEVKRLGNTVATIEPPTFAPIRTASEMLQGREPGVVGLSSSGLVGEAMKIRIRGNASLTQSNEPIIFVDGLRINSSGASNANATLSNLDAIDPSTIERIEILKGAAAATLYGTEASNGVIQIFTKQGSAGPPKWDVTVSQDFSNYPTNRIDDNWGVPTRAGQLDTLKKLWGRNDLALYTPFSEPLQRKYFETGSAQTVQVAVTGGTQNLNYLVSGNYSDDDGPWAAEKLGGLAQDVVRRSGGRTSVNFFMTPKVRLGAQATYSNTYANRPQYGNNIYSPVTLLEFSKPDLGNCANSDPTGTDPDFGVQAPGVCKIAGNPTGSPNAFGTPRETAQKLAEITGDRFISSMNLAYMPTASLNVTGLLGVDYLSQTVTNFQPFGYNIDGVIGDDVYGDKGIQDTNNRQITLDVKANWTRDFLTSFNSAFLAGVQGFLTKVKYPGSFGYDFPGPGISRTDAAGTQQAYDGILETVNGGYFAQDQVAYKNFLYLTVGSRYDYSSAFGKSAAGVLYPKASISFVPSDLAGFHVPSVSSLRLRAAWGKSGRQPSAFAKFTTFAAQTGPSGAGLRPDNLGNPDLKPEVSTEVEGGTEIGFLHDRIGIEATYWKRRVNDLLFGLQYPPSGGFTNAQLTNVGVMDAHGTELALRGFVVQTPDVSLEAFSNIAFLKQKVVSLGAAPELKTGGSYARIRGYIREGYAPGEFFGAKLKQVPAGSLPYDINKDGVPDTEAEMLAFLSVPRDYTAIFNGSVIMTEDGINSDLGKPTPDYTGSFGANINFAKNWRVSSLFEYKGGHYTYWCLICGFRNASPVGTNSKLFAQTRATLLNPASTAQQRLDAAKVWANDLASLTPYQGLNEVSNGDFLRFRELSVTWLAPRSVASRIGGRDVSFTLTGRNLFLWTKYQGVDPEVSYVGGGGQVGSDGSYVNENFVESIDAFGFPLPRRIGLSVRIGY
ncbi:MAG TPA: SusC/RagA family TonB-linked outer membrane protein [Gemmatimonadaceae bacterium]|nr:SusC/RagA family TonB-linked outer membrane protein [Gemmatimonadaceae bacterium]